MEKKVKDKIKKNGRPLKDEKDKRDVIIPLRFTIDERIKLDEMRRKISPSLSTSKFLIKKIFNEPFVAFRNVDLPKDIQVILTEIAKLGSQFKMVASRKTITLWQEKQFLDDSNKIRKILDSTSEQLLELQEGHLYYNKIGESIERFDLLLNSNEADGGKYLENDPARRFRNEIFNIYQNIIKSKI